MSTEIRVPITIVGWVVLRDLSIDRVEVDRHGWEYGPIPWVSEYGEDPNVLIFRDLSEPDPAKRDRIEGDVNITEPVHQLIDQHDAAAHRWVAGSADLDPNYADLKKREVEALHRYGERTFGDAWWPGQTKEGYSAEDAAILDEMGYFEEKETDGDSGS